MGISNGEQVAANVGTEGAPWNTPPRSRRLILLLLALILSLTLLSSVVRAPPPIPMTTSGHAFTSSGAALPVGTPIRTFIDGVIYSNASQVLDASGSFSVYTVGNFVINGTTPEPTSIKHGANRGEPVQFAASDFTSAISMFQEVVPWFSDTTVTQDLHLASFTPPLEPPSPLKLQGIVTQPAQGGSQYVFLCNPSAVSVTLGNYYLQVDRPGTYYGGNFTLAGSAPAGGEVRVNLASGFVLTPTGDALKLVYRNPGGPEAAANGMDVVVDRVEFNASNGGTLSWQPGATIMGAAPSPGPGQILERSAGCADTNSPSDFHLAIEPGLQAATSPVVAIAAPSAGASVMGGQTYTVRWSMTSNVFAAKYLRVWVNLTLRGTTILLVSGGTGNSSVDWQVPAQSASGVSISVDVVDPFGNRGTKSVTFSVVPPQPFSLLIAVLLVVVVVGFIVAGILYGRREKREADRRTLVGRAAPPTGAPPVVPAAGAVPVAGTKECPRCHTRVRAEDVTCFFCGYSFVQPPI